MKSTSSQFIDIDGCKLSVQEINIGKYYYKSLNNHYVLHRLSGPAIDRSEYGKKNKWYNEFWINGKELSEEEFLIVTLKLKPEDAGMAVDLLNV